jgi:hypothetical protein
MNHHTGEETARDPAKPGRERRAGLRVRGGWRVSRLDRAAAANLRLTIKYASNASGSGTDTALTSPWRGAHALVRGRRLR